MFSYTWSEAPFVFFLLALAVLAHKVVLCESRRLSHYALLMFLCGCGLFLSRYIGALSVGIIMIAAAVRAYRLGWRATIPLLSAMVGLMAVIAAYLLTNQLNSGYVTGQSRLPASESSIELIDQLSRNIIKEFIHIGVWDHSTDIFKNRFLLFEVFAYAAIFWCIFTTRKAETPLEDLALPFWYLFTGSAYLAAVILIRWIFAFDPFDFRLLDPGFVLIFIALYLASMRLSRHRAYVISYIILISAVLSCTFHLVTSISRFQGEIYTEREADIVALFKSIPHESVIIFGDDALHYLRPDLRTAKPDARNSDYAGEEWDDFLASLDTNRQAFLYAPPGGLKEARYAESVEAFVAKQPAGALLRVK